MKKKYLFIMLFLFLTATFLGQNQEIIKSERAINQLENDNLGKIVFTPKPIEIYDLKKSDFLKSIQLNDQSNLNIRIFLNVPLIYSLRKLSPTTATDELLKNGNYQFTFYVNNKIIYSENLNTGAGTKKSKTENYSFSIPLISTKNEDSWGRFLWSRFYSNGGQEALTNANNLLKIEIKPYLNWNDEILTGAIIAEGEIRIITEEVKMNKKQIKVQKIKPSQDWKISIAKFDEPKIEALNKQIASGYFKNITSIVVIKDEKILLEEYFNGANRNTLHDTRSVGKSFTSTLLGIAIKDEYIKNEFQTLNSFYNLKEYKNFDSTKDSITLKNLLTMSAPFDGTDIDSESAGNEENMYPAKNWVQFTLDLPIDQTKASNNRWDYFTAGVVVLGDIINQSVPGGLENYAYKKLFEPLNITKYQWQYTPQKVVSTAGGLQLRTLDFAKYGQLYKNEGLWNGKQILTKEWVTKSLSKQIVISEDEFYGYLFWNKTFIIKDTKYEVFYSSGNGGNKIFIFKDFPIVIVITSTAYNTPYGHKQIDKIMTDYLIPAVIN